MTNSLSSSQAMFDILEADIVVMQETKIQRKDLSDDMVLVSGTATNSSQGYSGVAIYTRNSSCAPIRAEEGVTGALTPPKSTTKFRDLPKDQQIGGYPRPGQLDGIIDEVTLDSEGRCVILEFPGFVLLGVYSPANRNETRDDFRIGFFQALGVRIRNLVAEGKQVILTGDLNVIRSEIDSTNVAEALRKEGMSLDDWRNLPARRMFNQLIFEGSVIGPRDEGREEPVLWDLCRCFHPERTGMNTCWDTKRNTRPANNGSRIDYILCSDGIKSWFTFADIQAGLMGSDHCPVFATFSDQVNVGGEKRSLLELMNPPDMFRHGQRQRDWGTSDLLPLSAKLIPEFNQRRSIRDMFAKKPDPRLAIQDSTSTEAFTRSSDDQNDGTPATSEASVDEASVPSANATPTQKLDAVDPMNASSQSQSQPNMKRPAETTSTATTRSLKKSKSSTGVNSTKNKAGMGQRTLQGFFKPKAPASPVGRLEPTPSSSTPTSALEKKPQATNPQESSSAASVTLTERSLFKPANSANLDSADKVFDPIEAKESWSKLLGRRVAPRCEHNEPCISFTTKKPGVNCGESANLYRCMGLRLLHDVAGKPLQADDARF
ncbi:ap endonuclease 2 [Fusarium albosuccineum]|uniref:Ap endonuclease 2 n=1 Tax=Fusarium albosuccineum TaxID=1237068 RepID=A0A8H4P600_9HYPO|nr:ap endonuclease 2 [Fusarium albosuccineum]